MITVSLGNHCPRITITNDRTFEEVCIECRDYEEENKLLINLVTEFLNKEVE